MDEAPLEGAAVISAVEGGEDVATTVVAEIVAAEAAEGLTGAAAVEGAVTFAVGAGAVAMVDGSEGDRSMLVSATCLGFTSEYPDRRMPNQCSDFICLVCRYFGVPLLL